MGLHGPHCCRSFAWLILGEIQIADEQRVSALLQISGFPDLIRQEDRAPEQSICLLYSRCCGGPETAVENRDEQLQPRRAGSCRFGVVLGGSCGSPREFKLSNSPRSNTLSFGPPVLWSEPPVRATDPSPVPEPPTIDIRTLEIRVRISARFFQSPHYPHIIPTSSQHQQQPGATSGSSCHLACCHQGSTCMHACYVYTFLGSLCAWPPPNIIFLVMYR